MYLPVVAIALFLLLSACGGPSYAPGRSAKDIPARIDRIMLERIAPVTILIGDPETHIDDSPTDTDREVLDFVEKATIDEFALYGVRIVEDDTSTPDLKIRIYVDYFPGRWPLTDRHVLLLVRVFNVGGDVIFERFLSGTNTVGGVIGALGDSREDMVTRTARRLVQATMADLRPAVRAAAAAPAGSVAKDPRSSSFCWSERLALVYRSSHCASRDRDVPESDPVVASQRARGALTIAQPGTRVYTSLGGYVEVVDVIGPVIVTANNAGLISNRIGLFLTPDDLEIAEFDAAPLERLWPLRVRNTATVNVVVGEMTWRDTIKVLRAEKISVPAGTFDTFVVERREQSHGKGNDEATSTYWFAPSVGFWIKYDYKGDAESTSDRNKPWQAVNITRPDKSVTSGLR